MSRYVRTGKGKYEYHYRKRLSNEHRCHSGHIRDKQYKVWVSSEKKIIRQHDLKEDPWESANLLNSDLAEHKAALQKFQTVLDSLPDKDARPLYEPRAPNSWDRKLKKEKIDRALEFTVRSAAAKGYGGTRGLESAGDRSGIERKEKIE
jgi:hypothetical protein